MSDTRELEARLREVSGQHFNDRVALWHHTINAAADALAAMRAEAENFHMAYRMKCDEETKSQAVLIYGLRAECERLREAIKAHNEACEDGCAWRYKTSNCAFRELSGSFRYGDKRCSDCPTDYTIEITPLPAAPKE